MTGVQTCALPISQEHLKLTYVNMGTCYDELNEPKKAIKVYDEGLKIIPNYYLLNFNKAITLLRENKNEEAVKCLLLAIEDNPYHSSSHYFLTIYYNNKIPKLLSSMMVVMLDSKKDRISKCEELIKKISFPQVNKMIRVTQ